MTRAELSDLSGIGAYDERYGRVELARFHIWPLTGRQGHGAFISCWCKPTMTEFCDDEDVEYWQHHDCL